MNIQGAKLEQPNVSTTETERKIVGSAQVTNGVLLILTFAAYAVIIVALWGSGIHNGMPSETTLVLWGDQGACIASGDPSRRFVSIFYCLSYVAGDAFGIPGSFVPYQLTYLALWIGRSILTCLVVRQLVPDRPLLATIAGLVVALYTADAALNWVGLLNLSGMVVWVLLGFLFFIYAVKAQNWPLTIICAVIAASAAYLTLWTYESPLPVCMAFPVGVAIVLMSIDFRRWAVATAIYAVPIGIFLVENFERYRGSSLTYQSSILRSDFMPSALASDLWFHLERSFAFWQWPHAYYQNNLATTQLVAFTIVGIGVVIACVAAFHREKFTQGSFLVDRTWARLFTTGIGLLVASYLVVLLISGNRNLWRTEFLPGFALGIVVACPVCAGLRCIPWRSFQILAMAALFLTVGWFSARCGVNSAHSMQALWNRHRAVIASILYEAPKVADGTLFVLRDVTERSEPFGHSMWFDVALQLAYPNADVAGIYYLDNGQPAPGTNIRIVEGRASTLPEGWPTRLHNPDKSIKHIVVLHFDREHQEAHIATTGPFGIGQETIPAETYRPCDAIVGLFPATRAVNRYAPISASRARACSRGSIIETIVLPRWHRRQQRAQ
jgi:hypothetical protein